MYLSKIFVNIADRKIVYHLDDSNFWHKKIMEGFYGDLEPRSDARKKLGILFRKEKKDTGVIIYVQSLVEPNWYGKSWVKNAEVKNIDNILDSFRVGKFLNFNLLCTPYYTDKETNKLRCYSKKEDKVNWLKEKEKYNGFKLHICEAVYCQQKLKNIGGNKETSLYLTNLQGVLEITDVDKFVEFYKEGVGRQKSYGAGMLMLY